MIDEKIKELEKERVRCIYCNDFVHIDKFAGITKKGIFCSNILCLLEFAKAKK